jgi:hypothetical protein
MNPGQKICTFVTLCAFSSAAWSGLGTGKVLDIALRTQDNVLAVKVQSHANPPGCANWFHTFAKPYDSGPTVKALYAALLSAQATGQTVRVAGTGACVTGTGAEEIQEMNVGPWGQ